MRWRAVAIVVALVAVGWIGKRAIDAHFAVKANEERARLAREAETGRLIREVRATMRARDAGKP